MIRTILVTHVVNMTTGESKDIYGRYDPVTLARGGWKIIRTYQAKYEMSDKDFAKYGTLKTKED